MALALADQIEAGDQAARRHRRVGVPRRRLRRPSPADRVSRSRRTGSNEAIRPANPRPRADARAGLGCPDVQHAVDPQLLQHPGRCSSANWATSAAVRRIRRRCRRRREQHRADLRRTRSCCTVTAGRAPRCLDQLGAVPHALYVVARTREQGADAGVRRAIASGLPQDHDGPAAEGELLAGLDRGADRLSGSVESTTSPLCTQSFSGSRTVTGSAPATTSTNDASTSCSPSARASGVGRRRRTCRARAAPGRASRRRHLAARRGAARPGPWGRPRSSAGPRTSAAGAAPGARGAAPARLGHLVDVQPGVVGPPVEPGDLVVLAVGVVVAALGAAALVAGGDHRHAVGQQSVAIRLAALAAAQREDLRVVGLALDPVVPGPVVVGAVAVVLAVGLVVLGLVADQVAHGEAVVRGDEVDRGVRRPAVVGVQVARAGQPGGDRPDRRRAAPRQKSRIASRNLSFHSAQGGGNSPTW